MNILNSKVLDEFLKIAILNNNLELEFIYGSHFITKLNRENFLNLIDYLNDNYTHLETINDLDIIVKNMRTTIHGIDKIKQYCKEESLQNIYKSNITYLEKKEYKNPNFPKIKYNYIDNDNNYKLNIKSEDILSDNNTKVISLIETWGENKKLFRYKKRYSYLSENELFQIDLTVIKTNKYNRKLKVYEMFNTFKESNILANDEIYELEIEYIGNKYELNRHSIGGNINMTNLDKYIQLIQNKADISNKKSNIYDNSFTKYSDQVDMQYDNFTFSNIFQEDTNIIGKICTINDTYWDKIDDKSIRDEFYSIDRIVTIADIYIDYDGDFGEGNYVNVTIYPSIEIREGKYIINRIIPTSDIYLNYNRDLNEGDIVEEIVEKSMIDVQKGGTDEIPTLVPSESEEISEGPTYNPGSPTLVPSESEEISEGPTYNPGSPLPVLKISRSQADILDIVISELREKYKNISNEELFNKIFDKLDYGEDNEDSEESEETYDDISRENYDILKEEFKEWWNSHEYQKKLNAFYKYLDPEYHIDNYDYSLIPMPDKLQNTVFMEELWVPQLSSIINNQHYPMEKNPEKNTIENYQLMILKQFMINNSTINISDIDRKIYKLGNITKIKPVLYYNSKYKSYFLNYKISKIDPTIETNPSLEVEINSNPIILNNLKDIFNKIVYNLYTII